MVLARKKLIEQFEKYIDIEVVDFLNTSMSKIEFSFFKKNIRKILNQISRSGFQENEYSRLGYFMFADFKSFFIDNSDFDDNTKKVLLNIYQAFSKEILST